MQQYRNNRNNGNIYDLRKDLQHTPPPSQQKGSSGSADGRYGFNGEPLSFAPDCTANGTVRRTRTDNSIEFLAAAPHRTERHPAHQRPEPEPYRAAKPHGPAGTACIRHGPQAAAAPFTGQKPRKTAAQAAQQRYKTSVCARHNSSHATRYSGKTQEAPPDPRCTEAAADAAAADGLCDPAGRDRRRCLPDHDHAV